jgi:hypothetical protein
MGRRLMPRATTRGEVGRGEHEVVRGTVPASHDRRHVRVRAMQNRQEQESVCLQLQRGERNIASAAPVFLESCVRRCRDRWQGFMAIAPLNVCFLDHGDEGTKGFVGG